MLRVRRVAAPLLPALLLAGAAPAASAAGRAIPPGQETLVQELLGGDASLPGGCRLRGAAIEPDRIVARYACAAGAVVVELLDPESAGDVARRTAQFAVRPRGTPPPGLLAALEARLRAGEAGFLWQRLDAPPSDGSSASPPAAGERPSRRGTPWIPLVALALAVAGLVGARPRARDVGLAVALWGAALVLRAALGPWGPFHVNGQGPAWLAAAIAGSGSLSHYGPGYAELLGPFAALWSGSPDTAVFLANATLCAAIPALAWVVARLLRLDPQAAFGAAVLLALDPVAIRLGATESYLPAVAAFTLGASALLLAAARSVLDRRWWVGGAFGLAAALLCAQVVRVHPVAWGPAALVPALALAVPAVRSWRRRLLLAAGAAVLVGTVVAVVSGGVVASTFRLLRDGALMRPESPHPGVLLGAAALVAAAVAATWRRDTRWLVLAAAPVVLYLAATVQSFGQSAIAQHGYARVLLTLPLLALAAHVRGRVAIALTAVLALLLVGLGVPVVRARTTEHLEYRWLRTQLAALPAGCYVAHVSHAGSRTLYLPVYPPRYPLSFGEGRTLDPGPAGAGRCVYYVHGSICTSPEGRAACTALERPLALTPVARTTLPAAPSFTSLPYDRETVECWVARVGYPQASTAAVPSRP
ncbi:MAG: hypothetical protein JXB32_09430 [Deltaproteobacteria bacterium]|nr:hypothetical protein [Deltaproteobacteria bacterium]